MKIIDKPWKYGTLKAYADVPAELLEFKPGCRVQPASYVGKPGAFYLINRYEPGENKFFPNGGFECRSEGSARFSFELDQVVLYQDAKVKVSKSVPKKAATSKKSVQKKAATKAVEPTKKTTAAEPKKAATKAAAKPVAKKAQAEVKAKNVCGAPKKDGTPCQMKTDGGLCRHHKAK